MSSHGDIPRYFLRAFGETLGPFDEAQIRRKLLTGQIERATSVSRDGRDWRRLADFPEFSDSKAKLSSSRPTPSGPQVASETSGDGTELRTSPLHYGVIAGGVLLLATMLAGFLVLRSKVLEILDKRNSRKVIAAWADVEDGRPPAPPAKEPLPEDWQRVLGPETDAVAVAEEPLAERIVAQVRLLNSALLTPGVTSEKVLGRRAVWELLAAIERLREGKAGREDFLCVGLEFTGHEAERECVSTLLGEIIDRHLAANGRIETLQQVETWGRAASAVVGVAYRADRAPIGAEQLAILLNDQDLAGLDGAANLLGQVSPSPELQKRIRSVDQIRKLVETLRTIATGVATWDAYAVLGLQPPGDAKQAKDTLIEWNRIAKEHGADLRLDDLRRAAEQLAAKNRPPEPAATPASGADPKKTAAKEACRKLLESLQAGATFRWPGAGQIQTIATLKGVKPSDLQEAVEAVLGGVEGWSPKAERLSPKKDAVEWGLKGLPGNKDARWATLRMKADEKGGGVVVEFEASATAPRACGFVPVVLKLKGLDEPPNADQPRCWFRFEAQELGIESDATLIGLLDPPAGEKSEKALTIKDWPDELKAVASSCSMEIKSPEKLPKGFEIKVEPAGKRGQPERLAVFYESELKFDSDTVPALLIEELLCSLQPAAGVLEISGADKPWKQRNTRWKPPENAAVEQETKPISPSLLKTGLVTPANWQACVQVILSDRLPREAQAVGQRIGTVPLLGSSWQEIEQANAANRKHEVEKKGKERLKEVKTNEFNALKQEQRDRFQKQYDMDINKLERDIAALDRSIELSKSRRQKAEAKLENDLAIWSPWPVTPHDSQEARSIYGNVGWRQEPRQYLQSDKSHFMQSQNHDAKNRQDRAGDQIPDNVRLLYEYRRSQQAWFDEVAAGDWSNPEKAKPEVNRAQNEWIAVQVLTELDGLILVRMKPGEVRQAFAIPLSSLLGRLTVSMPWQVEGVRQPVRVDVVRATMTRGRP